MSLAAITPSVVASDSAVACGTSVKGLRHCAACCYVLGATAAIRGSVTSLIDIAEL